MEIKQIRTHSQLGQIVYKISSRARRIRITVKSEKEVRITIPKGTKFDIGEKFLHQRFDWVLNAQKNLALKKKEIKQNCSKLPFLEETNARKELKAKILCYATQYNLRFNRLFFRKQKTRWGSCSAKNNINLNLNLARLPHKLQKYVMIHELVHTKVKSHDSKFWSEVERIMPDFKECRQELKKYHPYYMLRGTK